MRKSIALVVLALSIGGALTQSSAGCAKPNTGDDPALEQCRKDCQQDYERCLAEINTKRRMTEDAVRQNISPARNPGHGR